MYNTELIYQSFGEKKNNMDLVFANSVCSLCGKKIEYGVLRKYFFSSNFTNHDELKSKSDFLCKECAFCLGNRDLRVNNFICASENKIYLFKKNDIEKYIFDLEKKIKPPFIFAVTKSFKKHMTFKTKINFSLNKFNIFFENHNVLFCKAEHIYIYSILKNLYNSFSKDELNNLDSCSFLNIEKFGFKLFLEYRKELKQFEKTKIYNFLVYILNSEEKLEKIKNKIEINKNKNK